MKRMVIAEANKKLLGESTIDIDNVLHIMKFKFGWGDLTPSRVEEYANLFNDWLETESFGGNYGEENNEDIYN
jgi:hypothetical protein